MKDNSAVSLYLPIDLMMRVDKLQESSFIKEKIKSFTNLLALDPMGLLPNDYELLCNKRGLKVPKDLEVQKTFNDARQLLEQILDPNNKEQVHLYRKLRTRNSHALRLQLMRIEAPTPSRSKIIQILIELGLEQVDKYKGTTSLDAARPGQKLSNGKSRKTA